MLSARVESSMSRKTSIRVVQVTGCLPLPFTHSRRIAVLICSALRWCSCSRFLTTDPFLSSRRIAPNWTYLVDISTAIFLPPVCVNCSSSGRLSLVPKLCVMYWQRSECKSQVRVRGLKMLRSQTSECGLGTGTRSLAS